MENKPKCEWCKGKFAEGQEVKATLTGFVHIGCWEPYREKCPKCGAVNRPPRSMPDMMEVHRYGKQS